MKSKTKATKKADRWVVVATATRPWTVAFGRVGRTTASTFELLDVRMCVYFSSPTHGLFGLAARGPQDGSRVSERAQRLVLRERWIEGVLDASPDACAAWERGEWT